MSIPANFFKAATTQTPPAQPNNSSLEGAAGTAPPPAGGTAPAQPAAPLAVFDKLWETDTTKPAATPTGVLPAVTVEQLSTTLAKSNFLANIPQELKAKAASGDAAAFDEVINAGLRNVMTQSVLASHGLVNAGAKAQSEQLMGQLPSLVRSNTVSDSLNTNPLYKNPAIKPVMDTVRSQLEAKFPQASSSEIAGMLDSYFVEMSKAFGGADKAREQETSKPAGDTDWFAMLGLPQ